MGLVPFRSKPSSITVKYPIVFVDCFEKLTAINGFEEALNFLGLPPLVIAGLVAGAVYSGFIGRWREKHGIIRKDERTVK